jgi:phosphatidylserine synthase
MKYVKGMYAVMALMIVVNLISEFILKSNYSAIASWITVALFFLGTLFFINARYEFLKQKNGR